MVQSAELLLDDAASAAVVARWHALAGAGLPSQAAVEAPSNRPHVTLAVSSAMPEALDGDLARAAADLPLPVRLGPAVVLGGPRGWVLAQLVVPSPALLALHERVAAAVAGCPGLRANSAPGAWTPHVTLARRMSADDVARSLQVLGAAAGAEVAARAVGLRRWDGEARAERLVAGERG